MAANRTSFTIEELDIPDRGDTSDDGDFVDSVAVRNDVEAEVMGNRDLAYDATELLPHWQDPYEPKTLFVAHCEGRIVGRGIYETEIAEGAKAAWLVIEVLSAYRGRGIGTAFFERLSDMAVVEGRTVLQSFAMHSLPVEVESAIEGAIDVRSAEAQAADVRSAVAADAGMVRSPTGFGSVPRDDPGVRFLIARGFTLEQVARCSRLELPVDTGVLTRFFAAATEKAGADYRVVTWEGRTPPEWRADLALLHQRMSTDAPFAGLEQAEDPWDEARIDALDERNEHGPRTILVAAVQHAPTGRLVAFNELQVSSSDITRPVAQQDTLVLTEHRGHQLGMLVKTANLAVLQARHRGHPSVITFNAEENRHMLAVNEALGFVAVGYEGSWKKVL